LPLNTVRVGHRYPAYHYEVGREKVREYARVTGWPDPLNDIDDMAAAEMLAPPTFAAVFTLPQAASLLGADPELGSRPTLHGKQEYEYHRAVRVGDVLRCTPSIVDIRPRGSVSFLTLEVSCVDATSGDPVVISRGTFMFPEE
jgi:acyl dehydratase